MSVSTSPPPPGRRSNLPTSRKPDILSHIRTGQAVAKPLRFLIYSGPGWGKTTLAVQHPDSFLVMSRGENSYETLLSQGRVPERARVEVETWSATLDVLRYVANQDEYKAVILDTASGIERLCFEHVCHEHYNGDFSQRGFENYGAGYKTSAKYWLELLSLLETINKAKTVILLDHQEITKFSDPLGHDTNKYRPALSARILSVTERWPDNIFRGDHLPVKVKSGDGVTLQAGPKVLYTSDSPIQHCKNKHGLTDLIYLPESYVEMWATMWNEIQTAREE